MSNVFDKSWEPAVIVALSLSVTVSVSMTVSLSVRECETYGLTLWCRRIDPMASHYDADGPILRLHIMKPTDRSGGFYREWGKSHEPNVHCTGVTGVDISSDYTSNFMFLATTQPQTWPRKFDWSCWDRVN